MTRVSLTEDYDDRSVIAKLKKMDEKLDANAGIVARAEESARASAESAQETADRFAGSVGAVVSDAKAEIAEAKAEVTSAKAEVDQTVTTVAQAVQTANSASASAQASAQTVQTYDDRLQRAEVDIQTLDGETADLYARDAMNLKSNEPTQTAQGLKIGTHDLTKAVTTDEAQVITGEKTLTKTLLLNPSNQFIDLRFGLNNQTSNISYIRVYDDSYNGTRDGNSAIDCRAYNPKTKKTASLVVVSDKNESTYVTVPIPTDSAPSNAAVTKYNVMSTDGKLNNLVHTIGTEVIEGNKRFATAPTNVGSSSGFRGYTQFTDVDRTAGVDGRHYVHSVIDRSNRALMNMEHGTDNNGARDYITFSCCGSGARDGLVAQMRLNFTSSGVNMQLYDPVAGAWRTVVLQ